MTEASTRPISDRWELTERIGSGAMGEVWRGRHRVLGHDVAVKIMKRDASRDQSLVARFLREARIAAQLRHRNVARVEDFGTTPEGRPFLVMELLHGRTLEDLVERGERVTRARALTVARHVGAACDAAHAQGVVHRDLKPANCFLLRDEEGNDLVKVLDFGVAKVADGLLATQHAPGGFAIIGTPVYMSPEQARGEAEVDKRSDLWSVGVMLYELLTGELPFQGASLPQLLLEIQTAPLRPPSGVLSSLPPSVDGWAERALARDPAGRFQSGRELAEALAVALAAGADSPRPSMAPISFAPTESLAALPLAHTAAPTTWAPTQPMQAVSTPAPAPLFLGSVAPSAAVAPFAPASAAPPSVSSVDPARRVVTVITAVALLGLGIFVAALALRASPEEHPRPTPIAPAPARPPVATPSAPTPVAPAVAVPAAPAAPPHRSVRPAGTATIVAPGPSASPAANARRPREPEPEPRVMDPVVAPQPVIAPQPAPSHAPYNPDEP